jgi:hypothetical protein
MRTRTQLRQQWRWRSQPIDCRFLGLGADDHDLDNRHPAASVIDMLDEKREKIAARRRIFVSFRWRLPKWFLLFLLFTVMEARPKFLEFGVGHD